MKIAGGARRQRLSSRSHRHHETSPAAMMAHQLRLLSQARFTNIARARTTGGADQAKVEAVFGRTIARAAKAENMIASKDGPFIKNGENSNQKKSSGVVRRTNSAISMKRVKSCNPRKNAAEDLACVPEFIYCIT